MPNFDRTLKALAEFDAGKERRNRQLHLADTMPKFRAWEKVERDAGDAVRRAFWEDTSEYNRLETIMRCMSVSCVCGVVQRCLGAKNDGSCGQ